MTLSEYLRSLKTKFKGIGPEIARTIIAVEAERFHAENFRKEAFDTQAWPARKKPETPQRALLVKTSALKGHALRGRVQGDDVVFTFPLDYMRIHNEGGKIAGTFNVRAHTRRGPKGSVSVRAHQRTVSITIPKRQYVGVSKTLTDRIQKKCITYLNRRLSEGL